MKALPVLAEVSGLTREDGRNWGLRRGDLDALAGLGGAALRGQRTVLITATGEAGPPLALALAGTAAASGRRTALVECDLERPRLAAEVGLEAEPGLHEYLRWEATPQQLLQPLTLAGSAAGAGAPPIACVAAGRPATKAATLLGLGSFRHMAAKMRSAYDLLIMVGAPLGDTEGALLATAAEADGVIAAVGPEQTSGAVGRQVHEALAFLPATSLGAVVVGA
jgi:succinoglycan biosynthesis transport protein ExoP